MTPKQREAKEALEQFGSQRLAAEAIGISRGTLRARLDAAAKYEDMGPGVADALEDVGISDISNVRGGWLKTKGASIQFRVPEAESGAESIVEAIKEGLATVPPALPADAPQAPSELCALFPVADLHVGLLTDAEETGNDWDTKIASKAFQETFGKLVSVTPSAGTAVLCQLGDLLHVDDQQNVTPSSKHQLDVDSRYFMILRRAVASMKWAIEALRRKYPMVVYNGSPGNHDPHASVAVTLALAEHYRDIPDVHINEEANEFFLHEFGANMTVCHHGHKVKPERLVHFVAAQWPEAWGRTKHRIALSGHIHHERAIDIGGMTFESIGTIIPRDAYAYSHGYTARRGLCSITLHETDGEISRARVGV